MRLLDLVGWLSVCLCLASLSVWLECMVVLVYLAGRKSEWMVVWLVMVFPSFVCQFMSGWQAGWLDMSVFPSVFVNLVGRKCCWLVVEICEWLIGCTAGWCAGWCGGCPDV